jgi:hypothetical protein
MTTSFISLELVEEISKESSSGGRYINPAKIEGERRLRFFGQGISGWEAWTTDNKPVRWETKPSEFPANIRRDDGNINCKRFLMGVVYDYEEGLFKILSITQRTLMEQLFRFVKDSDYGQPSEYDIKISRTGEGLKTVYTLVAAPPKPVSKEIERAYEGVNCNLRAVFDGDDPWAEPTA